MGSDVINISDYTSVDSLDGDDQVVLKLDSLAADQFNNYYIEPR